MSSPLDKPLEPPSPEERLLVLLRDIAARLQDAQNGEVVLDEAVVPPAVKDVLRRQKEEIEAEIGKLRRLRREREKEI